MPSLTLLISGTLPPRHHPEKLLQSPSAPDRKEAPERLIGWSGTRTEATQHRHRAGARLTRAGHRGPRGPSPVRPETEQMPPLPAEAIGGLPVPQSTTCSHRPDCDLCLPPPFRPTPARLKRPALPARLSTNAPPVGPNAPSLQTRNRRSGLLLIRRRVICPRLPDAR